MPHMMRKQYFIKGPIQSRYLILTVFSMIVPTLLVSGCLYYLIATLMAHELALPESIYGHLIPVLSGHWFAYYFCNYLFLCCYYFSQACRSYFSAGKRFGSHYCR